MVRGALFFLGSGHHGSVVRATYIRGDGHGRSNHWRLDREHVCPVAPLFLLCLLYTHAIIIIPQDQSFCVLGRLYYSEPKYCKVAQRA